MKGVRVARATGVALALAGTLATVAPAAEPCYAGLRRSSYGLKTRNNDDAWWADRAQWLAGQLTSSARPVTPAIVEIVAIHLDSGVSRMEFARPDDLKLDPPGLEFKKDAGIDHVRALDTYARRGVKAILQIEPGKADVARALQIVHETLGRSPAVIGYGVDAEWYRTAESPDKAGIPVSDRDAEAWMRAVASFGPGQTLFLKHWRPAHMPPAYRHDRLWFLDDSQQFDGLASMMKDFKAWSEAFKRQTVGFQIGYPKDENWWSKMDDPPKDIGRGILRGIPNTRYVFWVDFTADRVRIEGGFFKDGPGDANRPPFRPPPRPRR